MREKNPANKTSSKNPLNSLKIAERHFHIPPFSSFKLGAGGLGETPSSIAVERIERHQKEQKGKTLIRVQAGSQIPGMDHHAVDAAGKPEGFVQAGWWKFCCEFTDSRYWQSGCVPTGAEKVFWLVVDL